MKISLDWLSDFIELTENDPTLIADRLTRGTGEVDEVSMQGKYLTGVVVGKIKTLGKHPAADRLSVCDIETDKGLKHVVCGGTNLKQDQLIAFAHVGATVMAGGKEEVTLSQVKIRGVDSEGMICAAEEIELSDMFPPKPEDGARPIADLTKCDFKVGTPLRTALGLTDTVLHIDNHAITNRPDLFSHIGVARELVALGLATWKKKPKDEVTKFPSASLPFTLKNDAEDLVPEYIGCMIEIDGEGETPDWMKRRLEATGWRSINLVVDITNYVLMEVGMPLHAFDADDFRGTLHIRKAKKGEKITTLDEKSRDLPEGAVVISDDEGIFDLFGVMGGLRTSNKPTTKHIFVQAGVIQPIAVRQTVIAMGHRTDAATVYEKGVSLTTAKQGLSRAAELFVSLHPKAKISSKPLQWGSEKAKKSVTVETDAFAAMTGADIAPAKATSILIDLGFDVKMTGKKMTVTPPSWRNDIAGRHDLVEEVARIYGYANVPPVMPDACVMPPVRDTRINALRDSLSQSGAVEMLHLAFTSPEQMKRWGLDASQAVAIENPIGEEISLMRQSLLPSLVETAAKELKHADGSHLKVFEIGHVFFKGDEHAGCAFAVLAHGKTTIKDSPLLVAKAHVVRALAAIGYDVTVRKGKVPARYAHDGRSAEIVCQNQIIGHLFELHPAIAATLGLQGRVGIATIGLHRLLTLAPSTMITKPLPVFPAVTFDETAPLSGKRTHGEIINALKAVDPLMRNVEIVNLYESDAVRSVTMRFTYRADDRTLTQEEATKVHAKAVAELKKA